MKYTNKFRLPKEIEHWLKSDDYDYSNDEYHLSATTLLKSTRMILLEKRWSENLIVDISDLITARYGSAIHDSFEKSNCPNTIHEKRYYRKIDDYTISGKIDLILDKDTKPKLADLKSTSVWTYLLGSRIEDYIIQLSIYRWILQNEEKDLIGKNLSNEAFIYYIFTDWSKKEAIAKKDYPQTRIKPISINLLTLNETENFIKEKIEQIKIFKDTRDSLLPYCTKKELWQEDEKFAVIKKGAKKAIKVLNTMHEAIKLKNAMKEKDEYNIVKREEKAKRCNYCKVSSYCSQYQMLKEKNLI